MRVSFSMLNAFAQGYYDQAVAPFTGVQVEPTKPMLDGRDAHKGWESEVKKTGCLPEIFGGTKLHEPVTEWDTKRVVKLNDWLDLSLVLDVYDKGADPIVGIDFKRSVAQTASDFTRSMQHRVYHVGYPEMGQFQYHAYNPRTKEVTMAIIHLADKTLQDGVEWVLTQATGLKHYLEINNISLERKAHS